MQSTIYGEEGGEASVLLPVDAGEQVVSEPGRGFYQR
jgi:hypothetical protein